LAALIRGIPGAQAVDTAAVVAALPERTSGSDIREVVRRAVLAGDGGTVSTATLLTEVGSGRYRAEVPGGMYL
jgi:cell division protease FtsH